MTNPYERPSFKQIGQDDQNNAGSDVNKNSDYDSDVENAKINGATVNKNKIMRNDRSMRTSIPYTFLSTKI